MFIYLLERLESGKWQVPKSACGKGSLVWAGGAKTGFGAYRGDSEERETH